MTELAYDEWAPSGAAADVVRCVWSLRGRASGRPADPIVSDGCVELVFNLADPFEQLLGDRTRTQPLAMIVGPTAQPTVVRATGRIDVVGVRLQPWAAAGALGVPMHLLRDLCVPLSDVANGSLRELSERLFAARDGAARFELASREVSGGRWAVGGRRSAVDNARSAVGSIVAASTSHRPPPTVRQLAADLGFSVRTIERAFTEEVGLSPKALLRIARIQRALVLARVEPPLRWSAIAARAGFHDQPHLVREFRAHVGCAPSEFRPDPESLTAPFLTSR